ncbi:HupE/UreJ family protein [Sphingomonas sp. RT2P30]|uniref:HupE/UreJ family protein n=1 Tax=Parasphingomonas halimpatiens TaxID=3096162 RepID=UPI002FCAA702
MKIFRLALAFLAATASAPAWAHPGHDAGSSFAAGMLHPLTGFDHLATIILVGAIAGLLRARRGLALPVMFVGMMILGFALAGAGGGFPFAETIILASMIASAAALALLCFSGRDLPLASSLALVALFGAAHGFAHGEGLLGGVGILSFAIGFIATTSLLMGATYQLMRRSRNAISAYAAGIGIVARQAATRSAMLKPRPEA